MKFDKIPRDTKTLPIGLPRYLEGKGEHAALILHGFTGITSNMEPLAERLHGEGYTVSVPRLPGHGTNFADFHRTGWKDWLRKSIDSYLDLRAEYSRVYVIGLSMGGVLALLLGARFTPEKLALCAPALEVRNRLVPFSPLLRFFVPKIPGRHEEESDDPQRQFLAEEYYKVHSASSVAQFHRLQRMARARLSQVEADTLTIVSEADNTVPSSVADTIANRISSRTGKKVVLKVSGHLLTEGEEKERVAEEIAEWFAP